jgi:hypothetical protein
MLRRFAAPAYGDLTKIAFTRPDQARARLDSLSP